MTAKALDIKEIIANIKYVFDGMPGDEIADIHNLIMNKRTTFYGERFSIEYDGAGVWHYKKLIEEVS